MPPGFNFTALVFPLAVLVACVVAGLFARLLLARRLDRLGAGASRARRLLLTVARGSALLWFITLGFYLAALTAELPPQIARVVAAALLVLLIASVTWMLSRVTGGLIGSHAEVGALPSATVITNVARGLVLLAGLLVILQTLGVSITPMITALGVGGLAVALALQDTLANLFGGLHILLSRQVHTGDFVRLDAGQEGYVQDVTWRYTSILQPGSGLLVVPNAKLAAAITTNFTRPDSEVTVPVSVSIPYDADPDHVERVATDVAREVMHDAEGGVSGFSPVIHFQKLGVATIQFAAILQAKDVGSQGHVKHEFIKRLLRRFRQEGIELPGGSGDARGAERVNLSIAERQDVT
jgi:small-conductance mechanosensitive channel